MLEGVLLSLVAGVIGVVVGAVGASSLATLFLQEPIQSGASAVSVSVTITPELVLLGLGAAILLGALGSLYPAWRASIMRPTEAMRQN
jgi:putative ABC transport system permease protein